ncbi:MAG: DUF5302 domain-containing protein, partial [Dermatophilaceae bacterium]
FPASATRGPPVSSRKKRRQPVDDDVLAKFRAALDRKQSHGGADVSGRPDQSKADGVHGPEARTTQQMFRRKSGG